MVGHVGWDGLCRGVVGYVGWGGLCRARVGGSCRGGVGHTGVEWGHI